MKLPLYITLLSLLLFASTIESRKELKDHSWKNVMKDESSLEAIIHSDSKLLLPKTEIPFIKDIEPKPYIFFPNRYHTYDLDSKDESSSEAIIHSDSKPLLPVSEIPFIKDIEPRPYIFFPNRYHTYDLDSKDESSSEVVIHSDSKPLLPKSEIPFIEDIEPQQIIISPNGYHNLKAKESSFEEKPFRKDTIENPIIRMGHGSQEINPTQQQRDDPSHLIFFTINDMKIGKKIPFYLPQNDPSTTPPSLSKATADSIPFSLKQLPQILNFFSFPSGSPQAEAVELALRECEREPITGETKFCGTSMESMADFSSSALGLGGKSSSVKHLATTTTHLTKSHTNLQNYTLLQMPNEIKVFEYFACHTIAYPYAVHYCHSRFGDTKVLQFPMEGENGDRVQALAVCHMDTSDWTPKHPSFQVLKAKPGTVPVCHLFPPTDLLWIPVSTST